MTGAAYRWTVSFTLFVGAVTMVLAVLLIRKPDELDQKLALHVGFFLSNFGVALSVMAQLLHADHPDRDSLLNHRAAGFISLVLNFFPWVLFTGLTWFIQLPPLDL